MPALRTIVYVSSATHRLSEAEMEALLLDARERNQRHGITGILLYGEGNFMQCIEGLPDDVELIYARICATRHATLATLLAEAGALSGRATHARPMISA
jgi:Sensors of blue-light using FAD